MKMHVSGESALLVPDTVLMAANSKAGEFRQKGNSGGHMTCHVHHNAYSNNTNNTNTSTNNTNNNNNCSNHTSGQPTKINMDDKTTIVTSISPKFTPSTSAFSNNANITTIPNNYQTSINIKSNNNNNNNNNNNVITTTTTTTTSTLTSKNTTTIPSNITTPNNTNKVVFAAGNTTTSAATAAATAAATLTRLEYIPTPPKTTTNTATIITTLPTSASTPTTTTLRLPPIAPLTTTYNNNNNHQHHQHHQHQYHNHNTNNNNHSNNSTIITTDITSTVTTTTTNTTTTTTTTGNSCGNNNTIINNYNNEDEDDGDDDGDEDDDIDDDDDDDIENSNDTYDTTVHGGVHSLMDHTGTVCGDSQNTTSNGPVACTTGHIVGHMKRDNASITGRSANSTRNLRARSLRDSILRLTTQPKNRLSASKSSSRAFTEKVRYKRKTLQMMSRPLKRWLQENSKNPYPSRAVKQTLAKRSQMTLTQVSNWFANMRRRLKNTVPCRDGSWSTRITKYNDFVEGNAERFSDWSDGDSCDDTDTVVATDNCITFPKGTDVISESYSLPSENSPSPNGCQNPSYSCLSLNGDAASSNDTGSLDSYLSHPKFKQTILQRYLNDHTGYHVDTITSTRDRRVSGSLCSRDYEEMSTTSSSSRANGNNPNVFEDADSPEDHEHFVANGDLDIVDKEVNAIITLTTMAQSRRRF